jgi:hypothetical protein
MLLNTGIDLGIIFVTESICEEHARYVRDDRDEITTCIAAYNNGLFFSFFVSVLKNFAY